MMASKKLNYLKYLQNKVVELEDQITVLSYRNYKLLKKLNELRSVKQ